MNDLAQFVPLIFDMQACRIMDRNGNPWYAAMDAGRILGIRNYREMIRYYPADEKSYVICAVSSTDGTSAKPRARKTQRILIINSAGLMRLIENSRKPQAKPFKERIIQLAADFLNQGLRRACLPRTWYYRGEMLNRFEWTAKKEEAYMKRFPNADYEDFLRSLPATPPVPPEDKKAAASTDTLQDSPEYREQQHRELKTWLCGNVEITGDKSDYADVYDLYYSYKSTVENPLSKAEFPHAVMRELPELKVKRGRYNIDIIGCRKKY